jgi:hypothetical protein
MHQQIRKAADLLKRELKADDLRDLKVSHLHRLGCASTTPLTFSTVYNCRCDMYSKHWLSSSSCHCFAWCGNKACAATLAVALTAKALARSPSL